MGETKAASSRGPCLTGRLKRAGYLLLCLELGEQTNKYGANIQTTQNKITLERHVYGASGPVLQNQEECCGFMGDSVETPTVIL